MNSFDVYLLFLMFDVTPSRNSNSLLNFNSRFKVLKKKHRTWRGFGTFSLIYLTMELIPLLHIYQTVHFFDGFIGVPNLQWKSFENCMELLIEPITRYLSGE